MKTNNLHISHKFRMKRYQAILIIISAIIGTCYTGNDVNTNVNNKMEQSK